MEPLFELIGAAVMDGKGMQLSREDTYKIYGLLNQLQSVTTELESKNTTIVGVSNELLRVQAQLTASRTKCERLKSELDRFNGIAPCGHEWKFVDRRGDEFQECLQCECEGLRKRANEVEAVVCELFDDLPEDRCADPNCGGRCSIHARAKAIFEARALASSQEPASKENA